MDCLGFRILGFKGLGFRGPGTQEAFLPSERGMLSVWMEQGEAAEQLDVAQYCILLRRVQSLQGVARCVCSMRGRAICDGCYL